MPAPARPPRRSTSAQPARHYVAALRWAKHARESGARFDVEKKAATSLTFSLSLGAHSFAVPSKLVGTKEHGPRLAALDQLLRSRPFLPLQLLPNNSGGLDVRCSAIRHGEGSGCTLGHVQNKHLSWLAPLVHRRAVRCFALDVTGGTAERPTRGLNVAFSFTTPSAHAGG